MIRRPDQPIRLVVEGYVLEAKGVGPCSKRVRRLPHTFLGSEAFVQGYFPIRLR
jgi:hypothetical protein